MAWRRRLRASPLITGMPPATRRFELQGNARLFSRLGQLQAVVGDHRLVAVTSDLPLAIVLRAKVSAGPSEPPTSSTTTSTSSRAAMPVMSSSQA